MPVGVNAYIPLATVTLGSSASSVTFSSIPATYRDLVLVATANSTNSGFTDVAFRFNGDTGTNYSRVGMYGGVNPVSSFTNLEGRGFLSFINGTTVGTNSFTPSVSTFMDYSATDKHKTGLHRHGMATDNVLAAATRWASTAAVTSLFIFPTSGNFNTGSTFNLYGIAS
jgi:hypothetical protein